MPHLSNYRVFVFSLILKSPNLCMRYSAHIVHSDVQVLQLLGAVYAALFLFPTC